MLISPSFRKSALNREKRAPWQNRGQILQIRAARRRRMQLVPFAAASLESPPHYRIGMDRPTGELLEHHLSPVPHLNNSFRQLGRLAGDSHDVPGFVLLRIDKKLGPARKKKCSTFYMRKDLGSLPTGVRLATHPPVTPIKWPCLRQDGAARGQFLTCVCISGTSSAARPSITFRIPA